MGQGNRKKAFQLNSGKRRIRITMLHFDVKGEKGDSGLGHTPGPSTKKLGTVRNDLSSWGGGTKKDRVSWRKKIREGLQEKAKTKKERYSPFGPPRKRSSWMRKNLRGRKREGWKGERYFGDIWRSPRKIKTSAKPGH